MLLTPKLLFIPLLLASFLLPPYLTLAIELKPKIGKEFHKLKKMTLEELMDIKVSSVSKKEEIIFNSAATISLITQEDIEISLVGQNLLDPRHPELSSENTGILPSEVPQSFYGKLTWRY